MDAPISIGIPFYNAEEYLTDAIRSIFAQTIEDWELLLVNDGSTDRSLEIAFAVRDPRVRVFSDGENRKLGYRLNEITRRARYALVARMDADDLVSPFRLNKQLEALRLRPEHDLISTGICSITNDCRPVGVRYGVPDELITGRKLLLGRCGIAHATILGRKTWFLRNPYDISTDRTEDYELWLRTFMKKDLRIYSMRDPLYFYREEANVTSSRLLRAYRAKRRLYKEYGHLGFHRIEVPIRVGQLALKGAAVRALTALEKMNILRERRSSPIEEEMANEAFRREIDHVLATKVPGLD